MRIKNLFKKASVLMVASVMLVGLSACAKKGSTDPIKAAQENLADVKSMTYDMTMDMEFAASGEVLAMNTTMTVDQIVEPLQMRMTMDMSMGDLGNAKSTIYAVLEDGKYIMYMGTDDGAGNMVWEKQEVADMDDLLAQYDGKESLDLYMSSAENFTEKGTETIGEFETVKYEGVISKDDLNEVMGTSGVTSQLSELGLSQAEMEKIMKDLGNMPITLWIDKASNLPVKYEMDMTDIMQSIMTKMMEGLGGQQGDFTVSKVFISATLRNFNAVEKIEIPQEALDS